MLGLRTGAPASGPGLAAVGAHEFKVVSGAAVGTASDVQSTLRTIPIPDPAAMKPARGESLRCRVPSFSWARVESGEALHYQLEVRDRQDRRAYRSAYVRDMRALRVPAGILDRGQHYRWRVTVADGSDWIVLDNRSESRWIPFSVDSLEGACEYHYRAPEHTGDGWETSSLEAEGVDAMRIAQLVLDTLDGKFEGIHSMVLVKNGKLVLEEYFDGYTRNFKHVLASVTKSISSILIGTGQGGTVPRRH